MANPWISFLASFRKSHPKLSMKAAMKQGAVAYRKQKGTKAKKTGKKKGRIVVILSSYRGVEQPGSSSGS